MNADLCLDLWLDLWLTFAVISESMAGIGASATS